MRSVPHFWFTVCTNIHRATSNLGMGTTVMCRSTASRCSVVVNLVDNCSKTQKQRQLLVNEAITRMKAAHTCIEASEQSKSVYLIRPWVRRVA